MYSFLHTLMCNLKICFIEIMIDFEYLMKLFSTEDFYRILNRNFMISISIVENDDKKGSMICPYKRKIILSKNYFFIRNKLYFFTYTHKNKKNIAKRNISSSILSKIEHSYRMISINHHKFSIIREYLKWYSYEKKILQHDKDNIIANKIYDKITSNKDMYRFECHIIYTSFPDAFANAV